MAEMVGMEWIAGPFRDTMKDVHHVTDKATLYGLRAVGRKGVSAAKKLAPVYHGPDPRATAESGNLRKSISNSRTIVHIGTGDYSMKMGPFGRTKKGTAVVRTGPSRKSGGTKGQVRGVPLYRAKVNDQVGFMQAGVEAMNDVAKETFETAYAKAYERFK